MRVSELGVGSYSLSGAYGRKDPRRFKGVVDRAVELGVNFFDTAHAYGDAERVLGEALKPYRDDVVIASKIGMREGATPDLSYGHVKASCEESLDRLQTHYIDLYQVHFDDPGISVAETVGALDELVDEGKILRYGVGHLPAERIKEYFDTGKVVSVLMELSAVARSSRETLLPLCKEHGVGAIAFSVTGRGLLTGRIGRGTRFGEGDIRSLDPLFQRENLDSGLRVAERFRELGLKVGRTPVQTAIAWVLSHREVACALTGPSSVPHLEENLGASGWSLSQEDLEALESFFEAEDARLLEEQRVSLGRILSGRLPSDPGDALSDLVYAMETILSLGLASEEEVTPVFRELWGHRRDLNTGVLPTFVDIQERLREMASR